MCKWPTRICGFVTKRRHFPRLLDVCVTAMVLLSPSLAAAQATKAELRIDVVYDNVAHERGFATGWGFACLVRGLPTTILFDTGADGRVLESAG